MFADLARPEAFSNGVVARAGTLLQVAGSMAAAREVLSTPCHVGHEGGGGRGVESTLDNMHHLVLNGLLEDGLGQGVFVADKVGVVHKDEVLAGDVGKRVTEVREDPGTVSGVTEVVTDDGDGRATVLGAVVGRLGRLGGGAGVVAFLAPAN